MLHTTNIETLDLKSAHLTIGVFDGVHRGHQTIIRQLVDGAHSEGDPAVVLTFAQHPAVVLGHMDLKCLTSIDERAELLGSLGVDVVITHPFSREVAGLSAYQFMFPLAKHLGLKRLLVGYDFALGKGREGNPARLAEIGQELGYKVDIVDAVSDESGVISSTAIRKLITVGNVRAAADMLGHPYTFSGTVIHGDARGRTIGYPTANISIDHHKALPAFGIYACWASVNGQKFKAATSIGIRPTFENQTDVRLEAFLLDFEGSLYDQAITLEFVERLRDEMKFDSIEALVKQIDADVNHVKAILL